MFFRATSLIGLTLFRKYGTMRKYAYFFLFALSLFIRCESNAQLPSPEPRNKPVIYMVQGEGSITVADTVRIEINTPVEAGKVVLISLDGEYLPKENAYTIRLVDDNNQRVKMYGGWYQKNRMSYFVTSGDTRKYYIEVLPDQQVIEYIVNVKIDDCLPALTKLDALGNPTSLLTYMISNSPEELKPEKNCLGENGSYLVRSLLQGNANIYWEHCNDMGYALKFGVLMWNKDSKPITVKLNTSSAISWTEANGMKGAMCGVWHDWFEHKLNDNELNIGNSIVLPAYNPANPSASAKWIFMSSVPANDPVKSTFNGLLNVSLQNADGSDYSRLNVFCDVYAFTPGKENMVLSNVATNDIAQTPNTLRGSGVGAILTTSLPGRQITSDLPYRFVITGFDPPLFQKGENIETTYFDQKGIAYRLPTCYGYSVVYRFNASGFKSDKPIKAGFRMHPNSNVDIWSGAYVIVKRWRDGKVMSEQIMITNNNLVIFDDNVPQNTESIYDVVVSGMSSLPVEIVFCN